MNDDTLRHEGLTRREYVKYGGTIIGGGFLAGCAGESSPENGDKTSDSRGKSYSVAMSPMGEVEFDSVPKSI